MKRAIELDALAQTEMQVSEQLQDQIRTATPGTAPMIEAVAAAWVVRANAYSQSAMSQLMRIAAQVSPIRALFRSGRRAIQIA